MTLIGPDMAAFLAECLAYSNMASEYCRSAIYIVCVTNVTNVRINQCCGFGSELSCRIQIRSDNSDPDRPLVCVENLHKNYGKFSRK